MRTTTVFTAAALALVAGAVGFWVLTAPATYAAIKGGAAEAEPAGPRNLENGRELFYAGGCASCHATPGQDDRTKLGGGLALTSPFGTFYPPNISPDPIDGIGRWTLGASAAPTVCWN